MTLTLAIHEEGWLPDGILAAVTPDQKLMIYRLDQAPPPMPDGTVIWANAFTAEQYHRWTLRVHGDPNIN